LIGTYSSIFLAVPILLNLNIKRVGTLVGDVQTEQNP
jgi:preprotein translocase subunit SecF